MEIRNKKGDMIGKIQFQSLQDENIINKIIRGLNPGEGKAIYIADAVDNKFTQQTNYVARDWGEGLESLKEKITPWQPRFPIYSEMHKIQVYYGFDNLLPHEIDGMIEESERTGSNVVVRDLRPNNTLVGVNISYQTSDCGTYAFRIFGTTKSRIQVPNSKQSKIEQLNVRGNEAFYISNIEYNQLIWIEEDVNGKALQYEIMGRDISQEFIFTIAESMI
ncbi:hypothetical protein [Cohnella cellulosilytica]|uniref:DUF4367 domain-containing protein n=1 Tax=Cohnella cellulosilytica TaxID=986710 RepID=A0ABW2FKJ4_9BACL